MSSDNESSSAEVSSSDDELTDKPVLSSIELSKRQMLEEQMILEKLKSANNELLSLTNAPNANSNVSEGACVRACAERCLSSAVWRGALRNEPICIRALLFVLFEALSIGRCCACCACCDARTRFAHSRAPRVSWRREILAFALRVALRAFCVLTTQRLTSRAWLRPCSKSRTSLASRS